MQALISLKTFSENTMYIKTAMIEAFCYNEKEKITYVWTVGCSDDTYKFPGDHTDEIIAAIHGWDE